MFYGFVKQSGGHVTIYSEVGHGTTINLYFPRADGASVPETATTKKADTDARARPSSWWKTTNACASSPSSV